MKTIGKGFLLGIGIILAFIVVKYVIPIVILFITTTDKITLINLLIKMLIIVIIALIIAIIIRIKKTKK